MRRKYETRAAAQTVALRDGPQGLTGTVGG